VAANNEIQSWLDCLSGKLLLALVSTVLLCSESRGSHDHILLFDSTGRSVGLLLVLASTAILGFRSGPHYLSLVRTAQKTLRPLLLRPICCRGNGFAVSLLSNDRLYTFYYSGFQQFLYCRVFISCCENVFAAPLPSSGRLILFHYFGFQLSCHHT
jgi:hypothetical protein